MSENTEKFVEAVKKGDKNAAREYFKNAVKEKIVEKIEEVNGKNE